MPTPYPPPISPRRASMSVSQGSPSTRRPGPPPANSTLTPRHRSGSVTARQPSLNVPQRLSVASASNKSPSAAASTNGGNVTPGGARLSVQSSAAAAAAAEQRRKSAVVFGTLDDGADATGPQNLGRRASLAVSLPKDPQAMAKRRAMLAGHGSFYGDGNGLSGGTGLSSASQASFVRRRSRTRSTESGSGAGAGTSVSTARRRKSSATRRGSGSGGGASSVSGGGGSTAGVLGRKFYSDLDVFCVIARAIAMFYGRVKRLRKRTARTKQRNRAAFIVQCLLRRRLARVRVHRIEAAMRIAGMLRGILARGVARRHSSATKIQALVRGYLTRRRMERRLRLQWAGSFERVMMRKVGVMRARKELKQRREYLDARQMLMSMAKGGCHRLHREEKIAWAAICATDGFKEIAKRRYRAEVDSIQEANDATWDDVIERHEVEQARLRAEAEEKKVTEANLTRALQMLEGSMSQQQPGPLAASSNATPPATVTKSRGGRSPRSNADRSRASSANASPGDFSPRPDEDLEGDVDDGEEPVPIELDVPTVVDNGGTSSGDVSGSASVPTPGLALPTSHRVVGRGLSPRGGGISPRGGSFAGRNRGLGSRYAGTPQAGGAALRTSNSRTTFVSFTPTNGNDPLEVVIASPPEDAGNSNAEVSNLTLSTSADGLEDSGGMSPPRLTLPEDAKNPPTTNSSGRESAVTPSLGARGGRGGGGLQPERSLEQFMTPRTHANVMRYVTETVVPADQSPSSANLMMPSSVRGMHPATSFTDFMAMSNTGGGMGTPGNAAANPWGNSLYTPRNVRTALGTLYDGAAKTAPAVQDELGFAYVRIIEAAETLGRQELRRQQSEAFNKLLDNCTWSVYVVGVAPTINPMFLPTLFAMYPQWAAKRAVELFRAEQQERQRIIDLHENVPVRPPWDPTKTKIMPEAPSITKPRAQRARRATEAPVAAGVGAEAATEEETSLSRSNFKSMMRPRGDRVTPDGGLGNSTFANFSVRSIGSMESFGHSSNYDGSNQHDEYHDELAASAFGDVEGDLDEDVGDRRKHRRFSQAAGSLSVSQTMGSDLGGGGGDGPGMSASLTSRRRSSVAHSLMPKPPATARRASTAAGLNGRQNNPPNNVGFAPGAMGGGGGGGLEMPQVVRRRSLFSGAGKTDVQPTIGRAARRSTLAWDAGATFRKKNKAATYDASAVARPVLKRQDGGLTASTLPPVGGASSAAATAVQWSESLAVEPTMALDGAASDTKPARRKKVGFGEL